MRHIRYLVPGGESGIRTVNLGRRTHLKKSRKFRTLGTREGCRRWSARAPAGTGSCGAARLHRRKSNFNRAIAAPGGLGPLLADSGPFLGCFQRRDRTLPVMRQARESASVRSWRTDPGDRPPDWNGRALKSVVDFTDFDESDTGSEGNIARFEEAA
jgi:hypothetical protein